MSTSAQIWFNGRLCPADDARISPFDHGMLVGDGVFETLVARGGRPFAARRHYRRLTQSCRSLGIDCPSEEEIGRGMAAVTEASGLPEARIRVTVTSGIGPLGSQRGSAGLSVVIVASAGAVWPASEQVVIVPWPRNERGALAGVKSTSYAENVIALAHAKKLGAGEALFLNTRGQLCEGTGSNVFVVRDGRVSTPPLDSGCLAGVTRALVIERAAAIAGLIVHEEPLPGDVLETCDEAFLTSTTRDVQAIGRADDRAFAPAPGPVTSRMREAFAALAAEEIDP